MRWSGWLTVLTLAGVVAVGGLSYCAGRSEEAKSVTLRANGVRTHTAGQGRRAANQARVRAALAAQTADTVRRRARSRVVITSDTTVSIDSLPDIPVAPVIISVLRADDRKASADSLLIVSMGTEVAAITEEKDAWKERAELLKPPRCGVKCGVVLGATGALLLVKAIAAVL